MPDFSCPSPLNSSKTITLAHGSGGRPMQKLIQEIVAPLYSGGFAPDHDGAVFDLSGRLAFTTDSYVVKPLFFPGGDIGKLAIYGTTNDLAMCGAKPLYLSCSFILEEGLEFVTLQRICNSMKAAAIETGISIVTGDTKVVGKGQADGVYINTSGVGLISPSVSIHPTKVHEGDVLILSGDLGRHGIAVMSARENMNLGGDLLSDCAPLSGPVQALLGSGIRPKCLRDLTRGGLAAALHEISVTARIGIEVEEEKLPVQSTVRGACEILGLDPIYIANEGRLLAIVASGDADATLGELRRHPATSGAVVIGTCTGTRDVEVIGPYGTRRILPPMQGELLPRIC